MAFLERRTSSFRYVEKSFAKHPGEPPGSSAVFSTTWRCVHRDDDRGCPFVNVVG